MPSTFNANANTINLADAVAQDPNLVGKLYSRKLTTTATRHNGFAGLTSAVEDNPRGITSVFAKKSELKAKNGDTVKFRVMGTPGGHGVDEGTELTGNTSSSLEATWGVGVGFHRDAVEWTKDRVQALIAEGMFESTVMNLLGKKMGIHEENVMHMRLKNGASGNIYRPNNRASINDLLATDTLSLDQCSVMRSRLEREGGRPIMSTVGPNGSPIHGYLIYGGSTAFDPICNDDGYQIALANGGIRGTSNPNFTGELINWQGTPFYRCPEIDEHWDDYSGSPMSATGWNNVEFSVGSASAACKFVTNASNTKSRYFQFWKGYAYKFATEDSPSADSGVYYAWACNPDGSRAFVDYTGSANNGNVITIRRILAGADTDGSSHGTSTKGYKVVGNLDAGTTSTTAANVITPSSDSNLPENWVYTDKIQAGAYLIQANANGNCLGNSYMFGSLCAAYAYGYVEMLQIEQKRDYDFVIGRGYETIFGTGLVLSPKTRTPKGYLLVEHVIHHSGYPCPSVA